jgi:cysteinyl-tRNA synthetase
MLKIYNSLTRKKEDFHPIKKNKVRMYVCGVTVYDYCHIGHARTYTAFDVIVRYFKYLGYEVTYVRNITDIDDKIIKRAAENNEDPKDLVARFTQIMSDEFARLGLLKPDYEPKATETIDDMKAMIQKLIDTNHAYYVPGGDVYYDVASFKDYGKLSHQNLAGLQAGIRVDVDAHKKNPLDFVLWKAAKPNEPAWDSPWGRGRPGWHIECSAMSRKILGETFDIHGGGSDLKFPHHENEIAQSEAANDKEFAHYWLHTGMVQINQEKMSKSLGNFFVINDVLKQYPAEVVRYFLISAHYRSEINYSDENLESARASLTRLYTALDKVTLYETKEILDYEKRFASAMNDDFNTPEAFAVLFDLAREINRQKQMMDGTGLSAGQHAFVLKKLGKILGILQEDPEQFLKSGVMLDTSEIERLINERNLAKRNKDFQRADAIRRDLEAQGIILEDSAAGTTWRKS